LARIIDIIELSSLELGWRQRGVVDVRTRKKQIFSVLQSWSPENPQYFGRAGGSGSDLENYTK
jgi:hypothetical protein